MTRQTRMDRVAIATRDPAAGNARETSELGDHRRIHVLDRVIAHLLSHQRNDVPLVATTGPLEAGVTDKARWHILRDRRIKGCLGRYRIRRQFQNKSGVRDRLVVPMIRYRSQQWRLPLTSVDCTSQALVLIGLNHAVTV